MKYPPPINIPYGKVSILDQDQYWIAGDTTHEAIAIHSMDKRHCSNLLKYLYYHRQRLFDQTLRELRILDINETPSYYSEDIKYEGYEEEISRMEELGPYEWIKQTALYSHLNSMEAAG